MGKRKMVEGPVGPTGQELWDVVMAEYELDDVKQAILRSACECANRACQAKAAVELDGMIVQTERGMPHLHPAVRAEKDARAGMLMHLRELQLDYDPINPMPGRPAGR